MSKPVTRGLLLGLVQGDEQFFAMLCQAGIVPDAESAWTLEHADAVRVAQTLRSDLEVNWPGVEIILRMRSQLLQIRWQMAELVQRLHAPPPD